MLQENSKCIKEAVRQQIYFPTAQKDSFVDEPTKDDLYQIGVVKSDRH